MNGDRGVFAHRTPFALQAAVAALVVVTGIAAGWLSGHLSLQLLAVLLGLVVVVVSLARPSLLLWALLALVVMFNESSYAVTQQSVFIIGSYQIPVLHLGLYECLVYAMLGVLAARAVITHAVVRLPRAVAALALTLAAIVVLNIVRAVLTGTDWQHAYHPFGGGLIPAGVAALWCFTQLLDEPRVRLRVLDVLFLLGGARALFALFRYFFGSGDIANAYAQAGVAKVAMWELAGHQLFIFLISVALCGWLLKRLSATRALLWLAAAVPMAAVVLFSFRRTSWLGLVCALVVIALVLLRRSQRTLVLVPALGGAALLVSWLSFSRFTSGGSLLARLLPDIVASGGITRQTEWALTWPTITQHLFIGGGPDARRLGIRAIFWNERVVHNAALWVWMKFGLIGLFTLLALVVSVGYYAFKAMSPRSDEDYIGVAIVALIPYLIAASATGTPLIENRTLLLSALLGALALTVSGAARRVGAKASGADTSSGSAGGWAAPRARREGT